MSIGRNRGCVNRDVAERCDARFAQAGIPIEWIDLLIREKVAIVNSNDESILAPILKAVADRHPDVYVKSRARSFGPDITFRITVSAAGASKPEVEQHIDGVLHDLTQELANARISIDSIEG